MIHEPVIHLAETVQWAIIVTIGIGCVVLIVGNILYGWGDAESDENQGRGYH